MRKIFLSCLFILFFTEAIPAAQLPTADFQISVSVQNFDGHEKEKFHLQVVQPYRFDKITLIKAMSSLAYQRRGVAWSNKRRVFNAAVTDRLAPMILEKFSLVNPDQRIVFRIKNATGKTILAGDTFLTAEGLHWRMTAIQKVRRKVDDFSVSGDPWRLVPLTRQSYKTKEKIKDLVQDINNWIVFDQIKPEPARMIELPPIPEETPAVPALESSKFITRLKILEDLKREGLIDEEEYQIKRQEILDDL